MKVKDYRHPMWGFAFDRIAAAFRKFSPDWVEWVDDVDDCDVYVVNVVGEGEVAQLSSKVKNLVVLQQCYFTAQIDRVDYVPFWQKAALTISFHNLKSYTDKEFNFYHMPLGVDPDVFVLLPNKVRPINVLCTGYVAEDESLDLVYEACKKARKEMYHTGRQFREFSPSFYKFLGFLPDHDFVNVLNLTKYIPCLRLVEGFEMMGVEGLFCGARPIVYDIPTYDWYRQYGYTINQNKNTLEQLVDIITQEPRPMSVEEHSEIVDKFSWATIVPVMFEKIRESVGG